MQRKNHLYFIKKASTCLISHVAGFGTPAGAAPRPQSWSIGMFLMVDTLECFLGYIDWNISYGRSIGMFLLVN